MYYVFIMYFMTSCQPGGSQPRAGESQESQLQHWLIKKTRSVCVCGPVLSNGQTKKKLEAFWVSKALLVITSFKY